jgi:feruloyl esterase
MMSSCKVWLRLGAALPVLFGCGGFAQAAGDASMACTALAGSKAFGQTEIASSAAVAATATLPSYCEVKGTIRPEKGSEIGVVYRLPEKWNGKLLALGGGGWMGNVTLQTAAEGLSKGYATLQTDAGHSTGSGFDASPWAVLPDGSANKPPLEDFSHRAIHLMTVRGKEVIAARYGRKAERAYYQGCSTGGRMGMMEMQRYPEDFDGVIAGAPVYTLQTQTSAQLRSNAFNAPGARLLPQHLGLINRAVLNACDAKDGAADGVLRDPRACDFDPAVLQCRAGASPESCLSPAQVSAVRTIYRGQTVANGEVAAYPLEKGGETGWVRFVPSTEGGDPGTNSGGMYALRGPLFGNPLFDMNSFVPESVSTVRSSWLAGVYEAKNPDISQFVKRGGKLLLYHGFSDPGPSARGTVEYFEATLKRTTGARDATRLFLAPGMGHCAGGTGPDRIDWLGALEKWVEKGTAPEELPASKAGSPLTWNVCAYPKLPTGQVGGGYACR